MRSIVPVVLALAALSVRPAAAEDVRFEASVDRDRVEVGGTVELTVTVAVPNRSAIESLSLPGHDGFEEVSKSQGTQMSFSFGTGGQTMQQIVTHRLVLRATSTGARTLSPGVLRYQGKTYRTDPITVLVLKAGQLGGGRARQPAPRARRRPDPMDPFGGLDPFDILRGGIPEAGDDDVFLRVTADKKDVYLGEQVTLYVQVYSRLDVADFPSFKMPDLDGFWVEDLNSPKRITPSRKYVGGVPYRTYLLRRVALFPMKAGTLTVDPVEVQIATGLGLFQTGRTVKRRSEPITLRVKPLPAKGQPKRFAATNVGQWDLKATVKPTETSLGQPVTLTLTATGRGNLESLELPTLPELDGLKAYDPTRSSDRQVSGARFGGTKKVEWVLVPTRTGRLRIPSLRLDWFDPGTGRYRHAETEPLTVSVDTGAAGTGAVASASGAAPTAPLGPANVLDANGLRSIHYGAALSRVSVPAYRSTGFYLLVFAPLFALVLVTGLDRARGLLAAGGRERKAPAVARARLKEARKLRKGGAFKAAFAAVEASLLDFVASRTGLPARGLPRDELARALTERGWAALRVERLVRILEDCETARFSPVAPTEEDVDTLLDRAGRVLVDLLEEEARR